MGASAGAVAAAQRQMVLANLRQALELVGVAAPAETDPPAPIRRVLLVLGMHRSGTSAMAGLLCQQGFQAPHNLDARDAHNPTGYWEPQQIRSFHNSLLEGAQSSWEDPLLPVLPWHPKNLMASLADLEQALAADFPTTDPQAVALIKDPRQCRLLPLWTALFEHHPFQVSVVLAVRPPEAVAASLMKRDQLPLDRALLLWLSHTLEAERATRQLQITTPSAELLGEWIRPGLNHHQRSSGGLEPKGESRTLLQWANTVYAALVEPAAEQQRELLDRAQEVVQEKLQALLEQLPEGGPQVLLVGSLAGAAGELVQRLQQARPEWALVEKPTELLPKPEAMRLPALPEWDRQELRILACSTGLHTDGWLETPSRLVIQLLGEGERAGGLRLGLYLPEQGLQRDDPTVLIQLDVEEPISQMLKPGLNTFVVQRPKPSARSTAVIRISSDPLVQPANASDQRRLMAVLAELELLQ